jgi:hypothetical protein
VGPPAGRQGGPPGSPVGWSRGGPLERFPAWVPRGWDTRASAGGSPWGSTVVVTQGGSGEEVLQGIPTEFTLKGSPGRLTQGDPADGGVHQGEAHSVIQGVPKGCPPAGVR